MPRPPSLLGPLLIIALCLAAFLGGCVAYLGGWV